MDSQFAMARDSRPKSLHMTNINRIHRKLLIFHLVGMKVTCKKLP